MDLEKKDLKEMMRMREEVEQEVVGLLDYLKSTGAGMEQPLVDAEGFPRADIDVLSVRSARHRNDLRQLMDEIEKGLHRLHSENVAENGDSTTPRETQPSKQQQQPHRTSNKPFLRVDEVATSSPAATAGLHVADEVIQFGTLCADNFTGLPAISEQVKAEVTIPLTVLRNSRAVHLQLTPRTWSGRGLLGCHVVPTPEFAKKQ